MPKQVGKRKQQKFVAIGYFWTTDHSDFVILTFVVDFGEAVLYTSSFA